MTSFTRKLYNRDPAAAEAFRQAQQFEHRIVYGRHPTLAGFTLASREAAPSAQPQHTPQFQRPAAQQRAFGKRTSPPSAAHACDQLCGSPACKHGCVLFRQH